MHKIKWDIAVVVSHGHWSLSSRYIEGDWALKSPFKVGFTLVEYVFVIVVKPSYRNGQ